MTDLQDRVRDTLAAVAATTDVSRAPTLESYARPSASRRWHRGRRLALAVAVGLLVTTSGLAVAQAAGLLPAGLVRAFPGDLGGVDPQIDASTAARVVSAPGPDGHRFVVWVARWRKGGHCVAMLFAPGTPGAPTRPGERDFTDPGGGCAAGPHPAFSATGGPIGDYTVFAFDLDGRVSRAVVQHSGGAATPVAVEHGWVAGWFASPGAATGDVRPTVDAVLVGYAADGRVVLRTHVQPPAAG